MGFGARTGSGLGWTCSPCTDVELCLFLACRTVRVGPLLRGEWSRW